MKSVTKSCFFGKFDYGNLKKSEYIIIVCKNDGKGHGFYVISCGIIHENLTDLPANWKKWRNGGGQVDTVVKKIADIEETAEAIVEHAQAQKSEIEKRIQNQRDRFDAAIEDETRKQLERIRRDAQEKMERILNEEREKNRSAIDNLKKEFEENHTAYAREILSHIAEV